MLNPKTKERELAYVAKIGWVKPIEGADNIELVGVGGWTCIAKKSEFKEGDLCVYFEIDSKLPEGKEWSEFLAPKHYKVKTMKLGKFNVVSQGLALPFSSFGWEQGDYKEGTFLTKQLGVRYAVEEDNKRKANSNPDAKINAVLGRHPQFAKKYGKIVKNNKFLRWFFILIWGKKKDNRSWIPGVPKTDEERIENRIWTLEDSSKKWIATEKIDGTSTTFYLKRGGIFHKPEYLVCSRNMVFDTPQKNERNYYQDSIGNVYLEMSEKYNVREVLEKLLSQHPSAEWVAIQAETFGQGVQKRDYGLKEHQIRAFNLLYSDCGRVGTLEMRNALEPLGIPVVPIISEGMILPASIEELRTFVHSAPSAIDGKIKEGIVFRTLDGIDSFKCVDPEFLLKYHQ